MPDTEAPTTRPTAIAPDASTSPVDWSRAIEAVHEDGRVVPARHLSGPSPFRDPVVAIGDSPARHPVHGCDGQVKKDHWWRIRNVQPTTPELDPALWGRMVALVREMASRDTTGLGMVTFDKAFREARAIVADLPKPVDPDLIEARKIAASMLEVAQGGTHIEETRRGERDGYVHVCIALAAIKRGRELAGEQA